LKDLCQSISLTNSTNWSLSAVGFLSVAIYLRYFSV